MTVALQELEESGFIVTLPDFGKKVKSKVYRLIDEYTLFYLRWIEQVKSQILRGSESNYWMSQQNSQAWKIWAGYAFENLCLKHTVQIKKALGIGAVHSEESHWQLIEKGKKRTGIDLLIDRSDHCINLCEMKFYSGEYVVSESYAKELNQKKVLFQEKSKTKKSLFTTLVTPYGVAKNAHALGSVQQSLVLDQLFER